MELQQKRHVEQTPRIEPTYGGQPDDGASQPPVDNTNVSVSYGIHHGRYPIGGMTVRAARQTLQQLINIDPTAIAVINGSPVDENQQISTDVSMIAFVKPSAMKGNPTEKGGRGPHYVLRPERVLKSLLPRLSGAQVITNRSLP